MEAAKIQYIVWRVDVADREPAIVDAIGPETAARTYFSERMDLSKVIEYGSSMTWAIACARAMLGDSTVRVFEVGVEIESFRNGDTPKPSSSEAKG